mmetsp:Transcript_82991/g.146387  ORF Transcript_82991/g.146387 Transcript_82991/m.146387 type:complete len:95 (-) Transcript_82991:61-345(-)
MHSSLGSIFFIQVNLPQSSGSNHILPCTPIHAWMSPSSGRMQCHSTPFEGITLLELQGGNVISQHLYLIAKSFILLNSFLLSKNQNLIKAGSQL